MHLHVELLGAVLLHVEAGRGDGRPSEPNQSGEVTESRQSPQVELGFASTRPRWAPSSPLGDGDGEP